MLSTTFLSTTFGSNRRCFICRRSTKRLHRVSKETIKEAFLKHKIIITNHARCCTYHLDNNLELRKDEYQKIPTKKKPHNSQFIMMLENISPPQQSVFSAFRDIENVDEKHCFEITGWSKIQFANFSSYISSINNSEGRSKDELIALYRYWLRKGVQQSTLAKMFGKKTSQQQISHYLEQIRVAINKDFVPFFLGAKRGKNYFLKHNNKMVQELHKLDSDILVFIADGSYCRCEKSSNNDVQYKTYSGQKGDLLMKPFLICCPDGEFIDCYGMYPANDNDASILADILENDSDLRRICEPGKTMAFLDRGNFKENKKLKTRI